MSRLEQLRALRAAGRLVLKAQPQAAPADAGEGADAEEGPADGAAGGRRAAEGGGAAGPAGTGGTGDPQQAGRPAGSGPADPGAGGRPAAPAGGRTRDLDGGRTSCREAPDPPPGSGGPAPEAAGLQPIEDGNGAVWRWQVVYPAHHRHGHGHPAAWFADLGRSLEVLAAVAGPAGRRQAAPPGPGQLLFLDLETTGLAVAAGHRPFLAGLAWFGPAPAAADGGEPSPAAYRAGREGRAGAAAAAPRRPDPVPAGGTPAAAGYALYLEQYLVPDLEPGTEAAWLAALARRVEERPWLVTFNGRGFDWPMLETRWQWHRRPAPPLKAHFDLLYPARRLWAGPGSRVNLRALEHRLLGFLRTGDIPGAEIPGRYGQFLRGGGPVDLLAPVLRHNRLDLLSLVGLAAWIGGWLAVGAATLERWDEALAGGREWERVDTATATTWYERALALAPSRAAVTAVARRLVPLYRRQRRLAEAVALLAGLCDPQHPLAPLDPWVDLAELWLRLRDLPQAARYLAQAERLWQRRQRLWRGASGPSRPGLPAGPLGHRLERLRQQLAAGGQVQARAL
ncbi:ribonuclease H-like domain-containing protein [Thermaerobacter sp. PB12/4term]|uniref:ribonuclease H-like domain-containing protein n=1 Tax=Thermaerobacter sp. PB12/4term TaxID=2293838 RepID=UPI000E32A9F3|nr:ribonuclease H-like domain-containing protein [Thermaerobacter sp. PB12/4term]QIA27003.1 ribonuclease H-like domain-containing protein [Thermaerobacter sp. PB12/4term]